MFNLKNIFNKEIKRLNEQVLVLKSIIENEKEKRYKVENSFRKYREINESEKLLYKFIGRRINYYEFDGLGYSDKVNYYREAKNLLSNNILNNEINGIIKDLTEEATIRAGDMTQVFACRMTINGLKLIIERLEDIDNPETNKNESSDPYSGI